MKNNMDKEFDNKLRDKLEGFHPEVPARIWDQIQNELDNKQETVVLGVQKERKIQWSRWAVAAMVLVAFGALLYNGNRSGEVLYLSNQAPEQMVPQDMAERAMPRSGESAAPGGKKLSDDIRTISRVLATTLQATERKTRVTTEELNSNQNHFALNTEAAQPTHAETMQNAQTEPARIGEKPMISDNLLASSVSDRDNPIIAQQAQLAQVENLNMVGTGAEPLERPRPASDEEPVTQARSRFGVSKLLNLMVAQIDRRDEKFVSFSNDDEGSLKIDFNLAQAKK